MSNKSESIFINMDNESLPNSDSEEEDVVAETFCLRLTPDNPPNFTMDQLTAHVDKVFPMYVVAEEISKKGVLHYHVVVETSLDIETVRARFKLFVDEVWPKSARKRGFGNKQYHLTKADHPHRAVVYATKQKGYIYKGYSTEYIELAEKESFEPPTRAAFSTDFELLKDRFLTTTMDQEAFIECFITLKAKHDQMVNMSHAYQYSLSVLIKRDPEEARYITQDYLKRQRQG